MATSFLFIGEALYVLGTFAGDDIYTVRNTPGNCMGDRFDWLVTFTYFLGDLLWQPAVFCMLFDAMNHDFEAEYEAWYLSGQHKSKPRYRIFSFFWWSLEWYLLAIQKGGLEKLDMVGHVDSLAYSIVNSIGFGLGSLLFHIGGLMMLAEQSSKRCQPSVAKIIPSLAEPVKQAGPHAAAERT
eukprot:jgi/Astpho2/3709/Aster-x1167